MKYETAFAVCFLLVPYVCADGVKIEASGPDELKINLPESLNGEELVTFRLGIRRAGRSLEDLEHGENTFSEKNLIVFKDRRLNLQKNDVINYLLVFKTDNDYHTVPGSYTFDGVYGTDAKVRKRRYFNYPEFHHGDHRQWDHARPPFFGPYPHFHNHPWPKPPHHNHHPNPCHDNSRNTINNIETTSVQPVHPTKTTTPLIDIRFSD